MIGSEPSQQIDENEESLYDQRAIQSLKQSVCLNNHQLLELTYNDQKFYEKLKELNHFGCLNIQKLQYTEALIYLTEAEKVLQYAASCGKTIQRKLIITTLNNEASLYQKAWQLEKAQSYLEAIIYNISSFFENSSDQFSDKSLPFTKNVLDISSGEYQDLSISLWRKKSLVIFYLQYCAINSQNKNNQRAFSSASKAVSLIKQISMDLYRYEQFVSQITDSHQIAEDEFGSVTPKNFLNQLATFKEFDIKNVDFQVFYKKTVKYIANYMKRLQLMESENIQKMELYKNCFQNYSIGTIMQINPIQLDEQTDKVDLKQEISIIQKHFKAIYLSIGHFILGTEGRFIAAQKYTLDENQRKNSTQYKESQIYHLSSIIILTKFLLCQSGYFDHIVNSFRNHYKLDILEEAKKYLEDNQNIFLADLLQDDDLFGCQAKAHFQVQQIQELESQIKTVHQIPGRTVRQNGSAFRVDTQESEDIIQGPTTPKQKNSQGTKSTKQSKNTVNSQNGGTKQQCGFKQGSTATKKSHTKKASNNPLTKSQNRLQTQEANRMMTTSQHEHKNLQKAINLLTSRQKQNKIKMSQMGNVKSSRSKKKSDYQFMTSQKKLHITNDRIGEKTTDKIQAKKDTIYIKRESDYGTTATSRSKHKRVPTSTQGEKKAIRRKDSCGELKRTKKVQNEYGMVSSTKNMNLNKAQVKSMRNNPNLNCKELKISKHKKQSVEKQHKLTSPELKLKKLKSPRNIKK